MQGRCRVGSKCREDDWQPEWMREHTHCVAQEKIRTVMKRQGSAGALCTRWSPSCCPSSPCCLRRTTRCAPHSGIHWHCWHRLSSLIRRVGCIAPASLGQLTVISQQNAERLLTAIASASQSPANIDAAKQWRETREEFKKKVARIVRKSQEML